MQTVALTFDDAPDPTNTARVLNALASAGVKATFFVNSNNQMNVDSNPQAQVQLIDPVQANNALPIVVPMTPQRMYHKILCSALL